MYKLTIIANLKSNSMHKSDRGKRGLMESLIGSDQHTKSYIYIKKIIYRRLAVIVRQVVMRAAVFGGRQAATSSIFEGLKLFLDRNA